LPPTSSAVGDEPTCGWRACAGGDETLERYPSDLADLLRLPPRARAILYLTIVDGEQYRAAAAVVGCSETAARTIASRALRELQRQLAIELDIKEPK
jgi:hypothetical protein